MALAVGDLFAGMELGLLALALAVGLAVVAAVRACSALGPGPSMGRSWPGPGHAVGIGGLVGSVLLLMVGRGALGNDDSEAWLGPRGPAAGLRELAIEGASHPGPRCRVLARSAGVAVWLDAPSEVCPLWSGQRIRVRAARVHLHTDPELPGDPSPGALARSQGATGLATVDRVWRSEAAGSTPGSGYWEWVARQRQRAWEVTRAEPGASFVVAAGLGVRSALSPEDRTALRRAGLGHLIAVSGLHVGLAAWALLALSLRVGARVGGGRLGVVLSWVPLLAYVVLTGASPPAVRAGIMAVGVGVGGLIGRPHHGPVLLAVTCVIMLVARPAWAFDPGFQLSVAAMATLVRAPVGEGIVRQTWRVTWAVLPLSLWHFGHAGILGVVSNLVAVPVFTLWVLPLGLVGWWAVPWLGATALAPASWGAEVILELARVVAQWPSPPPWSVAVAAGLALVVGVVVGRRDRHGRLHPRWGWLPPAPVALAVVAVVVWPPEVVAPAARWWVAGSPRMPAVVTVTRDGGRAIACVHEVSLAPERWRGLLDALGLEAAGLVPRAELAPHERALQQTLAVQGRGIEAPRGCPAPPPEALARDALEHCRRRASTRHGMALVDEEGRGWCFVGGRWQASSFEVDPSRLDGG
ncbi:ComEC/Rec2 family competence protein [Paraliomyxa miuraensis]|uniref:ComEC/Rec2 family competence protein n=1 Tax=Paraliomyxa miuraensis TaxID=376150 RepID=UPI00224D7AD0|nr:ComEC/Rec2 family competence protein [Paraliomyxa miuraensis]MCX4241896.1 ComEC/Rec2 family competence protein [Paraliomyxa miuraensis]